LVTFYDPALTSLTEARRHKPRDAHRPGDISPEDLQRLFEELDEVLTRDPRPKADQVDWKSVIHVVVERYGGRLSLLDYILSPNSFTNVTQQSMLLREQVMTMLLPYLLTDALPELGAEPSSNTSWVVPIAQRCARTSTSHLRLSGFTTQERRIVGAIEDVLHEICRVLTEIWINAFDLESLSEARLKTLLPQWRTNVKDLMAWLDWSEWVRCTPECGPEVSTGDMLA